jgi:hypothetical protein
MARPRSIPGLLFHLATLHVARRPGCAAVLALVFVLGGLAAVSWPRHSGKRAPVERPAELGGSLQSAVLRDGFAFTHAGAGHRVVELDAQGTVRRERTLQAPGALRVVGTRAGAAAAWEDGKRVRLTRVEDDADLGTWGRSVRQLCDGVASNASRFAVGWLEADDSVWIVHGPLAAGAEADGVSDGSDGDDGSTRPLATGVPLTRNDWCGVASAEHNVALMWRSGDRLKITMCTKKACSNLPASFKLEQRLPILGVGCLRNACLLATPDEAGHPRLTLVTTTGRSRWNHPLEAASGPISIVGVGDRAFAVGYAAPGGPDVIKIDRDGKAARVWRDPASSGTPALAWSSGRLLIAHHHGERAVGETIALAP